MFSRFFLRSWKQMQSSNALQTARISRVFWTYEYRDSNRNTIYVLMSRGFQVWISIPETRTIRKFYTLRTTSEKLAVKKFDVWKKCLVSSWQLDMRENIMLNSLFSLLHTKQLTTVFRIICEIPARFVHSSILYSRAEQGHTNK